MKTSKQKIISYNALFILLYLFNQFAASPLQATTLYEDAENGNTSGWRIYDQNPVGATISNVYDPDKNSQVIQLTGSDTANGYILGSLSGGTAWNNTSEKQISWEMNFNERFIVYISVQTQRGHRYLYYTASNSDNGLSGNGSSIHHGLGADADNGTWHLFSRDLEADLNDFESDNSIISVDGFLVRGSGLVDNISLTGGSASPSPSYNSEIVVRTIQNFSTHSDVSEFINMASENNVSIISVAFKQDEDDETRSGELFYRSSIAPTVAGYEYTEILEDLIQQAHGRGIMVKAWIPQFHDQIAYNRNVDWRMMAYENGAIVPYNNGESEFFVNPIHQDVQEYEISIVEEIVANYDIDGVVLDWVRFNDYNMDLSDYTRAKYEAEFGYDPIVIDFETDNPERETWTTWRNAQIADYIGQVRTAIQRIKQGISLGVYTLSPEWKEVGQDPALFHDSIDFISPMCYYDDWGYPIDWVYGPRYDSILLQTKDKVQGKEIIPVFDTNWSTAAFTDIFSHLRESYPEIRTISWFEYGTWSSWSLRRINEVSKIGASQ